MRENQTIIQCAICGYDFREGQPDDVAFVDDIPHTATGKIHKIGLRKRFKDYVLPVALAAE